VQFREREYGTVGRKGIGEYSTTLQSHQCRWPPELGKILYKEREPA